MRKTLFCFLINIVGCLWLQAQVIPPRPTITSQPSTPVTYCRNVQATVPFTASGFLLTYQWFYRPTLSCEFCEVALTNNTTYSGVNTNTLGINTGTLATGSYYYFCQVSNAGGTVFTNTVTFIVSTAIAPNAPTTTGASRCGTGSVTLGASGGTAGQYRWYTVASGGTAIAGQTAATYVTPSLTGTTNYWVAINNGTCESNRSMVTATINTPPAAPTTTGASRCGNGPVTLSASGGSAGQYRWYTVATGGTAIAGQTAATYVTPTLTGTTNYYVAINNGTCESTRTIVTATINTVPTAPTTTGAALCGSGSVTLSASGGSAGQYRWYTVPTGGTAIAGQTNNSYTTPVISTTTNYYVSIDNGTCESNRTLVVATINTIPSAPSTTGNAACGPSAVTLSASGGSAGQYRWYTVPTGGTAIAGQTNNSYTTPAISTTTNYYVSINNGTCESNRSLVVATINTIPSAPSTTGNAACGPSAVTLSASGGSAGQYRWYTVPTGGTVIAGQTNNSYTTPVISTTTNYYVSIDNGTCESNRSLVVATINTIPSAPSTTGNAACGPSAVSLSASGGSAGQYRWYTVATGGTAIAGQTNNSYTTPVISTTTNYYVSINNGTCESNRTLVVATINTIPSAPSTTGNAACGPSAVTLSASGGSAGQYRWYTVATGGTAIAGQTAATYVTPTLTGTTNYYVAINNGTCESTRTIVTATINTVPAAPTTTGAALCGSGSVTLSASGGSAGQYRWYTVPTGGTAIAGQTNISYTTPVISTTTNYYVSIDNGTCESNRTLVVATINTIPSAPSTTGNAACGPSAVSLSASGGSAGQYRWYTVATGGTAIAGQTNNSYTTPVISTTTNYYVSINNGTCESNRTLVVATINTIPSAPSTTGNAACGPSAVMLSASGGSAGQYRWYTVPTGGTAIAGQTNNSYTTPVISTTTNYYVSIDNGTCESNRTLVVATINTIPSAPSTTGNAACGPSAVSLSASGGSVGQYRWYTVATGGTAIAGQTNNSYTTPVISTTTNYYVSIDNGTCESNRSLVVATINTIPSAPSTTGNAACGPSAVSLSASGGSAGQYRWYTVPTGGTAIAGQTNATFVTPVISITTNYYVAINSGVCESSRSMVAATISTIPSPPLTSSVDVCGSNSVTLGASGGSSGQYRWYTVATGGTALPGETNNTFTTPILSTSTTYYVSINNGCESTRTAVTATINSSPAPPSTVSGAACGASSISLQANGGNAGEYRWYTQSTGGTAIADETNSSYTTPIISTTTNYYVGIDNGTCESERTLVVATINTIPGAPSVAGNSSCIPAAITLTATGGSNGQYRWYTIPTGGNAIPGETNSTYTTPVISETTNYYVGLDNGTCESARTVVVATIGGSGCSNQPPVITASTTTTTINGTASFNLLALISDGDDNLDPSTLTIVTPPISNAAAQINDGVLIIDYSGLTFAGTDRITIGVCDLLGSCSEQVLTVEVDGNVNVYNGISPNGDLSNEVWIIENIVSLADTRENRVSIFNRWGDLIFEIENYDNDSRVFRGINKNGGEVSSGIYFYKIEFASGRKTLSGYLTIKK